MVTARAAFSFGLGLSKSKVTYHIQESNLSFEEMTELQTLYPEDTKILEISGDDVRNHTAVLRLKCKSKDEFLIWFKEHQTRSGVTFRVQSSKHVNGKTVLYKALYRCQHNTLPSRHDTKKPSRKHSACQSKMNVTIKTSPQYRKVRSKDKLRQDYPTYVRVSHIHNHILSGAEAVKFKDPSETVKENFIELFKSHHPPSRALYLYKQDLQEEFEDDYFQVAADRSICPDLQWVYRLYYKKLKQGFGDEKVDLLKSFNDHRESDLNQELTETWTNAPNEIIPNEPQNVNVQPPALVTLSKDNQALSEAENEVEDICKILKLCAASNPVQFSNALKSFHSSLSGMKNEATLLSALHRFGKNNYLPLKAKRYTTTIPVQPTAISRRKSAIKGRRCIQSGRPAKSSFTPEHGYSKKRKVDI